MRRRTKTIVACGLLSVLAACDSSPDPLGPGTATLSAGCYTLTLGSWDGSGTTADPPDAFQLIEEPEEGGAGRLLIRPLPGHAAWDYQASWTPTGHLAFSGGFSGIQISLTGSESPFHGQAEAWTDAIVAGRKRPRATATLTSTACPSIPEPSHALAFTTSYVLVPDNDQLDLTSTWTLEAWVRLTNAARGSDQDVIAKWAGISTASYLVQIEGSGKVRLGTNDGVNPTTFVLSRHTLVSNAWYHVAATFDHGMLKLYLNGILDTTVTDALTPLVSFQPLAFGREGDYPGGTLDGVIDDVRIWNIARSNDEIVQFFTKRLQGNEPGLVGYWPLDQGSGQVAGDVTGHGLDGRLGEAVGTDSWDPVWTDEVAPVESPDSD